MTESGEHFNMLSSEITGSEFFFELYCHVCDEEGRHVEAIGFCNTCSDYLCDNCFRVHCRPKPWRHHELLGKDHMPRDMSSVRKRANTDKCTENCPKHPEKVIEYFCQSHQVLACSTCVIEEHRACQQLDHIPEVSEGMADSTELKEIFADRTTMENKANNIMKTSKDNIPVTKRISSEAITSLKKFRKDVNSLLDDLEKAITDETEEIMSGDTDKMNEISTNCSSAVSDIASISKSLATLRNKKQNCNMYVALKRARVTLQSIQHNIGNAERDNRITYYTFQSGSQLQDLLKKTDALGKISVINPVHGATDPTSNVKEETVAFPHTSKLRDSDGRKTRQISYTEIQAGKTSSRNKMPDPVTEAKETTEEKQKTLVQHVANIDVKSQKDNKVCWITGSVMLAPHKLVVTDSNNMKVKIIDTQKNSIVSEKQLKAGPWDVTLVNPDQLAVTLPGEKKIQFLNMTRKGTLSKSRHVSVNGVCRGIAYAKDILVVSFISPEKVEILTLNGDVQHTVVTDAAGQQIFTDPYYLAMSTDGDTIYVSDHGKHTVTSLTTTGSVLSVFKNEQLVWPRGIAVAADGNVYVCGGESRNVHMLTAHCELIEVLLMEEDINGSLDSMIYCEDNKQFYVSMGLGRNNIQVYQLTKTTIVP